MEPIKIQVILGSTREGRFSEKPGQFAVAELSKRAGVSAELIDLREWPLPFFDQEETPSYKTKPYPHEIVEQWGKKIASADAYVVIAPEYNHGYPAVLKNALDWLYREWVDKPIGFIAYGSAGGARSVEQLRQVVIELGLHPIRGAIHLSSEVKSAVAAATGAPAVAAAFGPIHERMEQFFAELERLARALKPLR